MAKITLSLTLSLLCSGASVVASDPTSVSAQSVASNNGTQGAAENAGGFDASSSSFVPQTVVAVDPITIHSVEASASESGGVSSSSEQASSNSSTIASESTEGGAVVAVDPLPFSWSNPKTWSARDTAKYLNPLLSAEERAAKVAAQEVRAAALQAEQELSGSWLKALEYLPELEETAEDVALKAQAWEKTSTGLAHTLVTGFIKVQGSSAYLKGEMQGELAKIADPAQRAQVVAKMTALLDAMKIKAITDFTSLSSVRGFNTAAHGDIKDAFSSATTLAESFESLKGSIEEEKNLLINGAKKGNVITQNPVTCLMTAAAGAALGYAIFAYSAKEAAQEAAAEIARLGFICTSKTAEGARAALNAACAVAVQALREGIGKSDVSADGVSGLIRAAGVQVVGATIDENGLPVFHMNS